jgi:hypothetical protein
MALLGTTNEMSFSRRVHRVKYSTPGQEIKAESLRNTGWRAGLPLLVNDPVKTVGQPARQGTC